MTESPVPPPPRRRLPAWLNGLLRVAATVALMAYAVRDLDWAGFRRLLAAANWAWWLAALAMTLVVQVLAGVRWAALARPLGFDFPRRFFVRRFFEGMFFSLCLPSSIGGDVVKAVRIGQTTSLRLLAACSVLADRLTGVAALGVLVGTAILARRFALGMAAAVGVFGGLLLVALAGLRIVLAVLDRVHDALPEGSAGREFVARLLPYRARPSLVMAAFGWSFLVQMGGAVAVALVARAVGVIQPVGTWFTVVPLVSLLMVLPISIGGFGVRENTLEYLLRGYGVPSETGVAIALLWGLCTIIAGLVGGVLFLLERRPLPIVAEQQTAAG
jgi:glycosyltransferase 2 family protein